MKKITSEITLNKETLIEKDENELRTLISKGTIEMIALSLEGFVENDDLYDVKSNKDDHSISIKTELYVIGAKELERRVEEAIKMLGDNGCEDIDLCVNGILKVIQETKEPKHA